MILPNIPLPCINCITIAAICTFSSFIIIDAYALICLLCHIIFRSFSIIALNGFYNITLCISNKTCIPVYLDERNYPYDDKDDSRHSDVSYDNFEATNVQCNTTVIHNVTKANFDVLIYLGIDHT